MLPFTPSPDVAAIVSALLDGYERRGPQRPVQRAIRVRLGDLNLPGYSSQVDPSPRLTANEQLAHLAARGHVELTWLPGQEGHLLGDVTLVPAQAAELFPWVGREPLADQRAALRELLLGDRFRFTDGDWRRSALDRTLAQLRAGRSPTPFVLSDPGFNRDLLAALIALDQVDEETPYRVFGVRVFNDSKAFERLKGALATLARRHVTALRGLSREEVLGELGLVANPTLILLAGPWRLVEQQGELIALDPFSPAVGIPATLAARATQVSVDTSRVERVVCVENLTSFYELIRHQGPRVAALCLWGNPAPPVRHLLDRLVRTLPPTVPLQVWADLDYGGLRILSTLRRLVSPRFTPYCMTPGILESHLPWARPLTDNDRRLLARLRRNEALADVRPLIDALLQRGLKLEQEAIQPGSHRVDP